MHRVMYAAVRNAPSKPTYRNASKPVWPAVTRISSFDQNPASGKIPAKARDPMTNVTNVIGSLALAGIFPLAGFWSKDEILVTAGQTGYDTFLYVGLIGAFLTAAYMTRCVYLTFFGEYRGHGEPHESPRTL